MRVLYDFLPVWRAKANSSFCSYSMGAIAKTLPRFRLSRLVVHPTAIAQFEGSFWYVLACVYTFWCTTLIVSILYKSVQSRGTQKLVQCLASGISGAAIILGVAAVWTCPSFEDLEFRLSEIRIPIVWFLFIVNKTTCSNMFSASLDWPCKSSDSESAGGTLEPPASLQRETSKMMIGSLSNMFKLFYVEQSLACFLTCQLP